MNEENKTERWELDRVKPIVKEHDSGLALTHNMPCSVLYEQDKIRRGVNRVQSDVSRSISALKQAESDAQVPAGSFVIVKKEGKLTRWYAGPLLASGNPSAAEPQPVKTQVQQPKVPSGLLGPLQFDDP